MPESINSSIKNAGNALREAFLKKDTHFNRRIRREIVKDNELDYIDSGSECVVIAVGEDFKKVAGIDYYEIKDPEEAKSIYYRQRLMKTLFPHNFPTFHASFSGEHFSGTIRERAVAGFVEVKYPFSEVLEVVDKLEMPLDFDNNPDNFFVGKDGGEYYMDKVDSQFIPDGDEDSAKHWDIDKVKDYMQKNQYSEKDVARVGKIIQRLITLDRNHRRNTYFKR